MESIAVSPEELFNARASAQSLAEANAFKTVPTNYYKAQGKKFTAKRGAATTQHPNGRMTVNCSADLYKDDKKVGSVNFFVSHEMGRTGSNKPDREFRLYNQLSRVLYPELKTDAELAEVNALDLMQRFEQYPIGLFVTETFSGEPDQVTGKKPYRDAKTEDEAKQLRGLGWKANNYVQSIGKVK